MHRLFGHAAQHLDNVPDACLLMSGPSNSMESATENDVLLPAMATNNGARQSFTLMPKVSAISLRSFQILSRVHCRWASRRHRANCRPRTMFSRSLPMSSNLAAVIGSLPETRNPANGTKSLQVSMRFWACGSAFSRFYSLYAHCTSLCASCRPQCAKPIAMRSTYLRHPLYASASAPAGQVRMPPDTGRDYCRDRLRYRRISLLHRQSEDFTRRRPFFQRRRARGSG